MMAKFAHFSYQPRKIYHQKHAKTHHVCAIFAKLAGLLDCKIGKQKADLDKLKVHLLM